MEALRCDAVLPRARVYPSLGTQTQRSIIGVGGNRLKNFFDKRPTVTFPAHLPRGGAERRDRRFAPSRCDPADRIAGFGTFKVRASGRIAGLGTRAAWATGRIAGFGIPERFFRPKIGKLAIWYPGFLPRSAI